jgi:hypothetical protein
MDPSDLTAAAQPDAIREALAAKADELHHAHHAHPASGVASVRTASYKGHEIVIKTTYEITVDGRPFEAPLIVDNGGRVYYHGLPTRDFASAVDLVENAIDHFPADFPAGGAPPDHGHPPEHAQHPHHEHGGG